MTRKTNPPNNKTAAVKKPELLAPAGGIEQLKAAVRFGADAVYLGAQKFGLRAFASNFGKSELEKAVGFAHENGTRVYVTINAFVYDDDVDSVKETILEVSKSGADAAIISDYAVLSLAKDIAPDLPLHISTQANTLSSITAKHWYDLGASRIILARELSLDRIKTMRANLPEELELEAFVHGAMCASYSGRCVLSNHMSGRDANQGECAQPCRWRYALVEEKRPGKYLPIYEDKRGTYIYSANDLCMIDHMDALCESGIASLKIEGRMKTDFYVATVTGAYRRAIDLYCADPKAYHTEKDALYGEICRTSHRPLSTGFYFGTPSSPPGDSEYSQHSKYIATVLSYDAENKTATVQQKNRFFSGEELTVLTPQGTFHLTVKNLRSEEGEEVASAPHPMQKLTLDCDIDVSAGDILRRDLTGDSDD